MPLPSYSITLTEKSFCAVCRTILTLLYRRVNQTGHAQFFICWNCKKIYESGKGIVEVER